MTPSGRVFQSFRRWPLVPTRDLVWLRSAIERSTSTEDSRAAQELLRFVDAELSRRQKEHGPEPGHRPPGTAMEG